MDDLIKQPLSAEAMSGTLEDIERLLAKDGTALLRQMLQSYMDARSAREQPVDVVGADGIVGVNSLRRLFAESGGVMNMQRLRALVHPGIAKKSVGSSRARSRL